jgi:pyruvate-formate lyase
LPTWCAAIFKLDGHHIQFNIVTAETLRDARASPKSTAT